MDIKSILISIIAIINVFSMSAQSDSIFTNLTSYKAEICTHAYDWEGLDQYEYLTVFSDDPISDTLRVGDQNGIVFASLWIVNRKTWLKFDSSQYALVSRPYFSPNYDVTSGYPLDEYFLLYDFNVLDTVAVGDTVFFSNPEKDVYFSILNIDTVQINNVEKVRFLITTSTGYETILIEGIGGLHPFTPILDYGLFGLCTCEYEAIYTSQTDTLMLTDTMIFGNLGDFCLTASVSENEKINPFNVYPNPVTGNSFTIQTEGNARIDEVSLYDNQGKKIEIKYSLTATNNCSVLTPNLSKGFYTIEIVSDVKYYRHKIIIR